MDLFSLPREIIAKIIKYCDNKRNLFAANMKFRRDFAQVFFGEFYISYYKVDYFTVKYNVNIKKVSYSGEKYDNMYMNYEKLRIVQIIDKETDLRQFGQIKKIDFYFIQDFNVCGLPKSVKKISGQAKLCGDMTHLINLAEIRTNSIFGVLPPNLTKLICHNEIDAANIHNLQNLRTLKCDLFLSEQFLAFKYLTNLSIGINGQSQFQYLPQTLKILKLSIEGDNIILQNLPPNLAKLKIIGYGNNFQIGELPQSLTKIYIDKVRDGEHQSLFIIFNEPRIYLPNLKTIYMLFEVYTIFTNHASFPNAKIIRIFEESGNIINIYAEGKTLQDRIKLL